MRGKGNRSLTLRDMRVSTDLRGFRYHTLDNLRLGREFEIEKTSEHNLKQLMLEAPFHWFVLTVDDIFNSLKVCLRETWYDGLSHARVRAESCDFAGLRVAARSCRATSHLLVLVSFIGSSQDLPHC